MTEEQIAIVEECIRFVRMSSAKHASAGDMLSSQRTERTVQALEMLLTEWREIQKRYAQVSARFSELMAEGPEEDSYRQGYKDAVTNYAVWNDGVQYVGALRRPLKEVLAEFSKQAIPVRY